MTRARWWAAAALLAGAVALFWRSADPEAAPAGKAGDSPKVKALLKERREELRQAFKALRMELLAGRVTTDVVLQVSRRLLQAELEVAERPADRLAALRAHYKAVKEIEDVVTAGFNAGRVKAADHHLTRAARMEVEITLLRAGGTVPAGGK
jgi:hypothetical protein